MARPHHPEVAVVERGDIQVLCNREYGGVNIAKVGIVVPVAQLADAGHVGGFYLDYRVSAGFDVGEEQVFNMRLKELSNPVGDLDHNRRWDQ